MSKVKFSPFDKWEYLTDVETCHAYIRVQAAEIDHLRANQINGDEGEELRALQEENVRLREALEEIEDLSSLVFEQTRNRLFLINKTASVALGADPKDFEPTALAEEKRDD